MKTGYFGIFMAVAVLLASPDVVQAQKGTGATKGMAQAQGKPTMERISGTLTSIKTGACEMTTGKAMIGTHFLLQTADKKAINLHLGPSAAEAVKEIVAAAKEGSKVEAIAFQTSRLPGDQFIAKSVTVGGKTLQLRDDNLRPAWASTIQGPGKRKNWSQGPCF